jgi:hypothetical protein
MRDGGDAVGRESEGLGISVVLIGLALVVGARLGAFGPVLGAVFGSLRGAMVELKKRVV